eukprot:834500-Karenia_brevis.AAC.1
MPPAITTSKCYQFGGSHHNMRNGDVISSSAAILACEKVRLWEGASPSRDELQNSYLGVQI